MPTPDVKICGLTTTEALDAVIAARATHIGLNFVERSPRFASLEVARMLGERAAGKIIRVGLFVDQSDQEIAQAKEAAQLDIIQLHGEETPERVAQVKSRFGLPVWKALPVAKADDIARAAAYRGTADFILFDAKTPKGSLPGGSGLSFDWSLLANYRSGTPWGLAGGLTPQNVAEAIRATGAPLVDTSSGVESAPGAKDIDKIAAFCQAVRQC